MHSSPHMHYNGLTQEQSNETFELAASPASLSSHILLSFILAERGTSDPVYVTPLNAKSIFGSKTFLKNVPWNVHQNDYLEYALSHDGDAVVKRIILPDAKKARIRIALEASFTLIPIYKYHDDWTLAKSYNSFTGQWDNIVLGQRKGLKITPHVTFIPDVNPQSFGQATVTLGESSKTYPIFDLEIKDFGGFGSDVALSFSNIIRDLTDVIDPRELVAKTGIKFTSDVNHTIFNKQGESITEFTLVEGPIDPITGLKSHLSTAVNSFGNLIGRSHVYQNNVETLLDQLINGSSVDPTYLGEKALIEEAILLNAGTLPYPHDVDFDIDINRYYFDILTGKNNKGNYFINGDYPGLSQLSDVEFTDGESFNFIGGSDGFPLDSNGEIDRLKLLQLYDEGVRTELNKFTTQGHPYQDLARFPWTVFYDSGYSMLTKAAALNINHFRPEVTIILAPYSIADYVETGIEISCVGATSGTGCIDFTGTWNVLIDDVEVASNLTPQQIKDYLNGTGEFNAFECVDEVPVDPEPEVPPLGCEGAIDTLNVSGQGAELSLKFTINNVYAGRIDGGLNLEMLTDILAPHGLTYVDGVGFRNTTNQYVHLELEAGGFDEVTNEATGYADFWTVVDLNNPTVAVKQRQSFDNVLDVVEVPPNIYNEFIHAPLYSILTACLAPSVNPEN